MNERRLRGWVEQRIEQLKDAGETCSQTRMFAIARSELHGAARRDDVAKIYAEFAPAEWQRKGRRPKKLNVPN
jgi:hypothetical protein